MAALLPGAAPMGPATGHACDRPPAREPDLQGPDTSWSLPLHAAAAGDLLQLQHSLKPDTVFPPRSPIALLGSIFGSNASHIPAPGAPPLLTTAICSIPARHPAARRSRLHRRAAHRSARHFAFWATLHCGMPQLPAVTGEKREPAPDATAPQLSFHTAVCPYLPMCWSLHSG
ncbi:hypothetical protein NDU88_003942 [Pleurodeles waltl]|uniref:Uncharacterized protein n=1 Tax=Pleurodeles waltl TaxID=8319 RepID=A0AAV7SHD8_PLEWA|nr:hypothetical protein NDU88_003942 [Pleurodeles waltl]